MQQIKIFIGMEQDASSMESEVNDWLRSSGARIVSVFGNIAPQTLNTGAGSRGSLSEGPGRRFASSDLFLCVVYETDG